ncbi:MFS transporter [Paenibacillus sp. HB172176]|uniref:MFS transporter n=1 Tax=Paenibacillus sp. HB172176 TaxID=2493690 RepID=UPI00143CB965|nr:MFS transporter [Paenibacillus sp. HB172176]
MSAEAPTYQENAAVQKKRWIILIVLNLFTFMATLDASIVNIALPEIVKQLGLPVAKVEWVTTGYLMAICAVILFFGKLGDMAGKIRVYKIGMAVFIVGSLLCGLSASLPLLIASRIVQAIGAAMTMANSQGIVTDIFPSTERGRAIGIIGTFVSLGSIAGPSLGGIIVAGLGWPYIFLVNVPVGLIAIVLGWKVLPKDLIRTKAVIDVPGSSLFAVFIIALLGGLLLGQQYGYGNSGILAMLSLSVISFTAFILVELRLRHPVLQLSLFKNALFSLSIFCAFLVFVSNFCFNIIAPFYAQNMLNLSPSSAGFLLMLFPIAMVVVAPISGALSDKIGSEALTFAGLLVMVVAQFGLARLHEGSAIALVGVWIAMLGIGTALFQPPNNSLIMSNAPRAQLGSAGSANSLVRNVGMVVGITVATTILFGVMSREAGYRVTDLIPGRPDIFLSGMHVVFMTSSGICLVSAVLTGWRMISMKRAKKAARRVNARS